MDYADAITCTVTRAQALREIRLHSSSVEEFLAENGDRASYQGGDVLAWLGY